MAQSFLSHPTRRLWLSVALLSMIATVTRFWNIGRKPLWNDEAMEVLIASFKCLPDRMIYYLPNLSFSEGVRWLAMWGASDTVLRIFPAIMSLACVPLAVMMARRHRAGVPESLLAGLLVAWSPLQVVYAQEVRPYSTVAAYALAAHLFLDSALARGNRAAIAGWLIVSTVGAFTQGYLIFLGIHVCWILIRVCSVETEIRGHRLRLFGQVVFGAALSGISLAGFIVYAVTCREHLLNIDSYTGVSPVMMIAFLLGFLFGTPILGVVGAGITAFGMMAWIRQGRGPVVVVTSLVFVASILAYRIFGTTKFSIRFWLPIQPYLFLLLACGLATLYRQRPLGTSLTWVIVVAWIVFGAVGIVRYHQRPAKDIAAFDIRRDAARLRSEGIRIEGYLLPDLYAVSLVRQYRTQWGDRPVYLWSKSPDFLALLFGNMTTAPCPPRGAESGRSWVVVNELMPVHRKDIPFTNDISPWWTSGPEIWATSVGPSLIPYEDLKNSWFVTDPNFPGERHVVRWLDAPAGRMTCLSADAWRKGRWSFWKFLPGFGVDVKTIVGPPVDPAKCPSGATP